MITTDPIADLLTRIRNAQAEKHEKLDVPFSTIKLDISKVLSEEGFLNTVEVLNEDLTKKIIRITLKYRQNGLGIIQSIKRISKPGKRAHLKKSQIPKIQNGFGVIILSTSKGVLSGRDARINNVGGEPLCEVF